MLYTLFGLDRSIDSSRRCRCSIISSGPGGIRKWIMTDLRLRLDLKDS